MLKAAAVCLLVASATAAPAKGTKTLKMKKNMRSIKSDHARVVKHLNTLLVRTHRARFFSQERDALPRPQGGRAVSAATHQPGARARATLHRPEIRALCV